MCGRFRVGKHFLHVCRLVGAAMAAGGFGILKMKSRCERGGLAWPSSSTPCHDGMLCRRDHRPPAMVQPDGGIDRWPGEWV